MRLPLLEDDLAAEGVLEPGRVFLHNDAPSRAVMCFFQEVIQGFGGNVHATMTSVYGGRPMYQTQHRGQRVAFFYPGLGAPAAAACMEEAIALGCRGFVAVGGAGALIPELTIGHPVVVDSAVRDEGTSHHYLAPSRIVEADPIATQTIVASLEAANVQFIRGRTWTTDAIYRETRGRVQRRVAEGCITVEMEAAALFAIGQFRNVRVGQLLYAGDALDGDAWDERDWLNARTVRESLFLLALDAAAQLDTRDLSGRR
jgi:uridine phosphorylase